MYSLLFENYLLFVSLLSYLTAQVSKMILYLLIHKQFDLRRLLGSGGMPSSHAATVVALAVASYCKYGPLSSTTAITIILAAIVLYDARGVRQEVGKHSQILADLIQDLRGTIDENGHIRLNEMVGHTSLQVLAGSVIGLTFALCIPVF